MKVALAVSVIAAAVALASGKTATTQLVPMRETVLPSWSQIAQGASAVQLTTVQQYWSKLEDADIETYSAAMPTKAKQKAAKKRIVNYYNAAETCLKRHSLKKQFSEAKYQTIMTKVGRCLAGKKKMPKFRVAITLANAAPVVEDVDETDDDVEETVTETEPIEDDDDDVVMTTTSQETTTYQEPTITYQQPAVETTYQQPAVETTYEQPAVETSYQQPDVETTYEQPAIEVAPVEEHYEQPAVEDEPMDIMSMPNLRGYDEQPVAEEHYELPAEETPVAVEEPYVHH